MAVIEIAKIQVRRGQVNVTGVPQLDSGEFGWAVDQQKLYIGNGGLEEGAPNVGVTEILTENNVPNLFSLPGYTYQGHSGNTIITGPGGAGSTYRTFQSKLDDIVSIADFGVDPNYAGDSGAQLQQAIDQIFLNNKSDKRTRRKLYFPAGTYNTSATLYIPPYATIIGEGRDCTTINITSQNQSLMQTVSGDSTPGAPVTFVEGNANILGNAPTLIRIEGITLNYASAVGRTNVAPLINLDCTTNSIISNCKFTGQHLTDGTTLTDDDYCGINIRGQGQDSLISENVEIKDCIFTNIKYGVRSNHDINNITITNNSFVNLYSGVMFSAANDYNYPGVWQDYLFPNNPTGPSNIKITQNSFDIIEFEGVYVGSNTNNSYNNNIIAFNTFGDVAKRTNGYGSTVTNFSPVVSILSGGNVVLENKFAREEYMRKHVGSIINYLPNVKGKALVQSNSVNTTTIVHTSGATVVPFVKIPWPGNDQIIKVKYILTKPYKPLTRTGELTLTVSLGTDIGLSENYTYVGTDDGGISWSAKYASAVLNVNQYIELSYANTGDSTGLLEYHYTYIQ